MKLHNQITYAAVLLSALILTACGGGSGSGSTLAANPSAPDPSGEPTGKVQIVLTDAEDDFLTYKIDVVSITLKSQSGREVDVLTVPTAVDFVQYQELSELFAVRSIPAGRYDSIQLELNYSNSEIIIQDDAGTPYLASPVDSDGAPIGLLTVELQFGDGGSVLVSPARIANLTLDLDLSASNTILSFDPAEVLVEPFLMASVAVDAEREHRARGLLKSVDTLAQNFVLDLLPMRLRDGSFGEVTIGVNTDTAYEIDGIEYSGTEGLTALNAMPVNTPLVAYVAYDAVTESPLAAIVHAGTSVAWNGKDVLKGTVTARTDDSLSIVGGVIETSDGSFMFARNITLNVSDATRVTGYRFGDSDIDSLSVGQRLLALGSFTQTGGDTDSADIAGTFDATDALVQMQLTSLLGRVESTLPLTLDLAIIDRRPIAIFDFTGTGTSAATDADPDSYEVRTTRLNIANVETGEWVVARGYPTAFGSTPEDFDAVSIVDPAPDNFNATLSARWTEGADETIVLGTGAFSLNLDEGGMQLQVGRLPPKLSALFDLEGTTGAVEDGRYALQIRGDSILIYSNYTDFLAALTNQLNLSEARQLTARGNYNSIDAVLTANSIVVKF